MYIFVIRRRVVLDRAHRKLITPRSHSDRKWPREKIAENKSLRSSAKPYIRAVTQKFVLKYILKKKVLQIFGKKIKVLISGGAALNPDVGIFFNKLGISLLQGYGQTEASPLISCNRKKNNDPYTVGQPVKDVKVKISNNGENSTKEKIENEKIPEKGKILGSFEKK